MSHFNTLKQFLQEILVGTDSFVVVEHVQNGNAYTFLIDADTSFTIKSCVSTARQLRKKIEDAGIYPDGDYTLEVSSPGVDEPLQQHRQYVKNIGRLVEIEFTNPEQKKVIGRLKVVTEKTITLEITDKKKKTTTEQSIVFTDIKQTIVQIEF